MKRLAYFDNAKLILIFLVVFAHIIEIRVEYYSIIFKYIAMFHMPAFVLISGYFSPEKYNLKKFKSDILDYIVFYTIIDLLILPLTKFEYSLSKESFIGVINNLITPPFVFWYLIAMFMWRIITAVISNVLKTKKQYLLVIILSVLLAVLISNFDVGEAFSLSRVIVYYPFYMLGFYCKKFNVDIKTLISRKSAVCICLVIFASICIFEDYIKLPIIINSIPCYIDYGYFAGVARLTAYLIQFSLTIAFFALVPSKNYKITHLGENTFNIFVFHAFVVRAFKSFMNNADIITYHNGSLRIPYNATDNENKTVMFIIFMLISVVIVFAFGNIRCDIRPSRILKRKSEKQS